MELRLNLLVVGLGFLLCSLFVKSTSGANIMFFAGMSTYSHRVGMWPLVEKLADRGHSLTFVSPFPSKGQPHPQIHDYVPESLNKWAQGFSKNSSRFFHSRKAGYLDNLDFHWFSLPGIGLEMCTELLNDSQYLDWLNQAKFDLIVVDALVNECAYGMAHKLGAKIIVINTSDWLPHFSQTFGISDESSWIPDQVFHFPQEMNIFQRFVTLFNPLYFRFLWEFKYFPMLEANLREKLQIPDMPSLSEIERNVSLLFLNQHYAEDYARPLPPNVIPIGGMHCSENPGNVPKDLEEFINKGDSGFIYISFGSFADLTTFPNETQDAFLNVVKKFRNVQFVWKIISDDLKWNSLPENVYTSHWLPQQAILGHPKIRAFITHGGLFGIQEAIWSAVPLIAFPIFAEQDYNAVKIESREIGLRLEITTVTEIELEDAISKILHDEKYRRNMKRRSVAFKDRPEKAVESAVWWTEFVLRHENTDFLRPSSLKQSWWKRMQLDIWALIFITITIAVKLIVTLIKLLLAVLCGTKSVNQKKLKSS